MHAWEYLKDEQQPLVTFGAARKQSAAVRASVHEEELKYHDTLS
jgi:hypothetical protein